MSRRKSPASSTRKRKRAAVASFCRWAVRHDLLPANPMDKIDTIKVPKRLPRPAAAADVAKVLAVICSRRPRKDLPLDRLRGAGVDLDIHQLRHAHATSYSGVSIEAVRRRLGHASTETTQLYALWRTRSPTPRSAPRAADGTGQLADRPCAEQAQRNRVYLATAVLLTPQAAAFSRSFSPLTAVPMFLNPGIAVP